MPSAKELADEGFDLYAKGETDRAIEVLKQAVAADPAHVEAHRRLAMAYKRKGMYDEAIAAARRIIEIDPEDHLAYVSLSMFLQKQGKVPEAEEAMARAAALQAGAKK